MSEEEKKAINFIKEVIELWLDKDKSYVFVTDYEKENLKIVLNLIEKQQKEIIVYKKIRNMLEDTQMKLFETRKDEEKYKRINDIKYISKDKIREKIKELEERAKQEKTITFYCNSNDIARTVISNFNELLEEK
jgi:hypothetical protein